LSRKSKKTHLTRELCGNIPLINLVRPLRYPPAMATGVIATSHYGKNFTVDFTVHLYADGTGHAIFKYRIPRGDIALTFDETFRLEGRKSPIEHAGWLWIFVCKCKRKTRTLFFGWDHSCRCQYCLGVRTHEQQTRSWEDIKIAHDPRQLKRIIRTAYTPYKKIRAIKIYTDFLTRMIRAIRSKKPATYLKTFKH